MEVRVGIKRKLFSSVQFSFSVMSNSLRPHELQHARLPCPSPTSGAHPNSYTLSWWCHPIISSFVVPFSSHLWSFPASGSFLMSQFFASGGQSIGVSALASVSQSVQLLSRVWLLVTPWTAARQASLSITNSQSPPKPMSIELVMSSNHQILCLPLLLLPSILPSIMVFSNESALHIRWPRYWSFSFQHHPSNENPGLISLGWTGWISLQSKGLSRVFSNTTVQKHQFFSAQPSSQSNSHIHTWPLEKP